MLNYPFVRSLSVLLDNVNILIQNSNDSSTKANDANFFNMDQNQANQKVSRVTEIALEFQYTLLLIAESISTNQKVILQMHDAIISFLLPVLLSKVRQPSLKFSAENTNLESYERDSKFLSLKVITDIITYLLSEDSIYVPHSQLDTPQPTH